METLTLPQLLNERKELCAKNRHLQELRKIETRNWSNHERENIRANLARIEELDAMEREGRYTQGRVTQPDSFHGGAILETKPVRGGKLYREMFGAESLSSDGWGSFEEYLAAVHSGMHHPRLKYETLSMQGGVDSAGGFMVPGEHVAMMLDKSLENEIVRPLADVQPMKSDVKKISGFDSLNNSSGALFGGFTATWAAELDSASDKDAVFRMIELYAKKLFIFTKASNELVQDGLSFEEMLGQALVSAIGWHLDYACLRGTGAGQPLGVLNDPALITVTKEVGQPAATVLYQNLTKMFARMHPACVNNAVWVVNQTAIPQLLQLFIPAGGGGSAVPVLSESNGTFRMLTRPVLFTEKMPSLGTKGDIILADFSQYTVGLRKEVSIEKSIHVGWQTDSSAYRAILRADGQGRWSSALTPRNGSTLSWCTCIETRS